MPPDASRGRRRYVPRFGLRSLFVFAILFCLLFAWIGRNLYEMRKDEAAVDTLYWAGLAFRFSSDGGWEEGYPGDDETAKPSTWTRCLMAAGLAERPTPRTVQLYIERPNDPSLRPVIEAMLRFPEIREAKLCGPAFDDDAIATLKGLPNLESLELWRTGVTGHGLESLAGNRRLVRLHVMSDSYQAELGAGTAKLDSLTTVEMWNVTVDLADAAALSKLPRLEQLTLTNVRLAEEPDMLLPLENAPSLKVLHLSLADGEADTLGALPRFRRLERLELDGVPDETLAKWPAMPALRGALLMSSVSDDGAQAFSAVNPHADVRLIDGRSGGRYRGGKVVP